MRALEKPHVKGKFHEHKPNRVMVYLQAGQQRFEYQDGRAPAVFTWKPNQVVFSKAEGMHAPEVVSEDPFNIVEVELKKPGSGKTLPAAPKGFKVEIDNDQVRVSRVKLAAHKSTASFEEAVNFVTIYLTPSGEHKFGDASWTPAGSQKIENNSDQPMEAVVVEVKS